MSDPTAAGAGCRAIVTYFTTTRECGRFVVVDGLCFDHDYARRLDDAILNGADLSRSVVLVDPEEKK